MFRQNHVQRSVHGSKSHPHPHIVNKIVIRRVQSPCNPLTSAAVVHNRTQLPAHSRTSSCNLNLLSRLSFCPASFDHQSYLSLHLLHQVVHEPLVKPPGFSTCRYQFFGRNQKSAPPKRILPAVGCSA